MSFSPCLFLLCIKLAPWSVHEAWVSWCLAPGWWWPPSSSWATPRWAWDWTLGPGSGWHWLVWTMRVLTLYWPEKKLYKDFLKKKKNESCLSAKPGHELREILLKSRKFKFSEFNLKPSRRPGRERRWGGEGGQAAAVWFNLTSSKQFSAHPANVTWPHVTAAGAHCHAEHEQSTRHDQGPGRARLGLIDLIELREKLAMRVDWYLLSSTWPLT